MATITFIHPNGNKSQVQGEIGESVMRIALANGIDGIVGECGGSMMCATCHCHVDQDWIGKVGVASAGETDLLDCAAAPIDERSRLSCQIAFTPELDGLVVHLPEHQV